MLFENVTLITIFIIIIWKTLIKTKIIADDDIILTFQDNQKYILLKEIARHYN